MLVWKKFLSLVLKQISGGSSLVVLAFGGEAPLLAGLLSWLWLLLEGFISSDFDLVLKANETKRNDLAKSITVSDLLATSGGSAATKSRPEWKEGDFGIPRGETLAF